MTNKMNIKKLALWLISTISAVFIALAINHFIEQKSILEASLSIVKPRWNPSTNRPKNNNVQHNNYKLIVRNVGSGAARDLVMAIDLRPRKRRDKIFVIPKELRDKSSIPPTVRKIKFLTADHNEQLDYKFLEDSIIARTNSGFSCNHDISYPKPFKDTDHIYMRGAVQPHLQIICKVLRAGDAVKVEFIHPWDIKYLDVKITTLGKHYSATFKRKNDGFDVIWEVPSAE